MSFTSMTGSALRGSENCRGSVWRANNEDRSAVVNQSRTFRCCWAFDEMNGNIRSAHNKNMASLRFIEISSY
jgi:hypothetical protein